MNSTLQRPDLSVAEKRALLADLLREKAARPKTVPASFAQQRLWFLSRLEPDSPAYNIPRPLRLRGALDVAVLRETFNRILARHEVLRGGFGISDGEAVQVIQPRVEIELPLIDLQDLSETEREAEVSRRAIADAEMPFDLTIAPLLRLCLLKLAPEEHVLLLTMHHIVSDGWSMGLLVREIMTNYDALLAGQQPDLPRLPIQYGDFARWQRDWLQGEVLDEQVNYWKDKLSGAPAVLNLPVMRSRPATQTMNGAHAVSELSPELTRSLKELSRKEGVTLFMTLLAAFKTLLHRYSGEQDIVVGSPIAGRNRAELENLIGFFVNSLPMRTSLEGRPTFRELLARVKETALGAYAHQDLPFEKLVEAVQPPRSLSHTPIFQVMFALQNQPSAKFQLPGLDVSPLKREYDTSKFDLTLFVTEADATLTCWLEYNSDLFDEQTTDRFLEHFEVLLQSIASNPDLQIDRLSWLTEKEQDDLVSWNKTATPYEFQCIHRMFEQQVNRTPSAVALVFEDRQLSYDELNQRANQLAQVLRKHGVGPEVLVGVLMERSVEMVIALLGILKAGGAYVPIDPEYPANRIELMARDSGVSVLLTQTRLRSNVPPLAIPIIEVSERTLTRENSDNLDVAVDLENLAYVIYTSGSTGNPKGTMNAHRGLANRLLWMQSEYQLTSADRVLQKTPFTFDVSVWEFFWPLITGATLVMARPGGHRDASYLVKSIRKHGITTLHFVPSMLQVFLEEKGIEQCRSVRQVMSSGEALPFDLEQRFLSRMPAKLHNLYGPTEAAIDVTSWECRPAENESVVPIGKPIANLEIRILDSQLQPVPIGVAGELFIGGVGVGRGYLDQPALTAEKFIPDPAGRAGSRLYRTGDLARYRSDGAIEYLGRLDHQIKLRGFRIELGEIEAALARHPSVGEAVVLARGEGAATQLIAYFTVTSEAVVTDDELRDFLKSSLPDYMVPAFFSSLDHIPVTGNGKLDRKALPDRARTISSEDQVDPQNETEVAMAAVWERVLGLPRVGLRDNFFELGGHSLLAVRLMTEIEKEFGKRIQLVSLFQNATVEALSKILRTDAGAVSWPTLVEIQSGDTNPPLLCISTPNVNALGYRSLARYLGPDQTVYGLQAQYPEDLQGEHSQAAVDNLAKEYLEEIRAVQAHGPYYLIGMCRGAHIAFEMARQLRGAGEEVALLGILDTWVLENTYNKFLYVEYYARRFRSALSLGRKHQVELVKNALKRNRNRQNPAPSDSDKTVQPRANPMHAYFPGPEFQPKTYPGRIAVFRARKQPLNRIRDKELGWGRLTHEGVDLHYIPGTHGGSLLSEPHVQILASALKPHLNKSTG